MRVVEMLDVIRKYVPDDLKGKGEILNEFAHRKPELPDYEGDRYVSWEVCPECHSALKGNEDYCVICGKAIRRVKLKW